MGEPIGPTVGSLAEHVKAAQAVQGKLHETLRGVAAIASRNQPPAESEAPQSGARRPGGD